ncbi:MULTISPECIES: glutamate/gamma-aminobutyrate family transporter YjeM [unclassified Parvimonas]|uniref:glutamate/gamma-aminobutyrate family transporter YjeM n=1 Tax=unclassified Parvimonas TaxID=1151464 RepID=UPI002B474B08|nr:MULTISPECIES: glutamate/gamma-aminobutyrate family transporter YjeM [unclassified Parvimonas]MEB3025436.1 glutamate/gamma-aminobutyrate family transporter YjeM [Parvimonas sp. M13]MEB3073111.1 glutamate/gamma-aminobutyrate family transporter YjeM [Parvimonas sp. C2]MEB3089608.1 glutamate/gamma-aminobutyrate family transporter YjeM [Parvimonas sp. M20]
MSKKKLSLRALVLMVFTSVFGFTNVTRSYYLMGYAAIPWYIISCLAFFLPFAFMIAEYGSAFKDSAGGIYSWMEKSSGSKYAFVVTFMWYASYIVWMVNVGSGIWIVLSNAIYGIDKTQSWSLLGLGSVKTLGILAILWIITLTFISTKGIDKIKKFTSFGGSAVALINVFLFVGGILMLILNKGGVGDSITANALAHSPNPDYAGGLQVLSFIVYAIFAYGGLEVVGGLVDQTENPEKNFPKGIVISAIVVSLGYSLGILIFGTFTKWSFAFTQFSAQKITLGNVSYIAMNHMGYQLGLAFGLAESAARNVGLWVSRYMGISMFLALTGAFFTLIYSPLKQLIGGTPKELWPESWTEQKNGVYTKPMIYQAICVIIMIAVVSFGGDSAQQFFQILVSMTNVSLTLPYFFIAYSFLAFRKNENIERPFVKFKTYSTVKVVVAITCFIVGFANLFTVIEPAISKGDFKTTIMSIAGPLLFTLIALYLYRRMENSKEIEK